MFKISKTYIFVKNRKKHNFYYLKEIQCFNLLINFLKYLYTDMKIFFKLMLRCVYSIDLSAINLFMELNITSGVFCSRV